MLLSHPTLEHRLEANNAICSLSLTPLLSLVNFHFFATLPQRLGTTTNLIIHVTVEQLIYRKLMCLTHSHK
mgnify:CR=1 FL=1